MSDLDLSQAQSGDAQFGDYFQLLKPRVMSLVVFTAFAGMVAAPGGLHPVIAFASILFIAIGAGASGALNMWWDADIDARMRRTASRPIPSGRVTAEAALHLGVGLSGFAVVMLALAANWLAAALLAFTILYYAVFYTMWLKRLTPQNIVIGGAAGAFPPMIGWAVVTGGVSWEAAAMFMLIFLWTPPHFWALALFVKTDYHQADVPMLTVTHGRDTTRTHIWAYSLVLVPVTLGLAVSSIGGPVLMAAALVLNAQFLMAAYRVWQRDDAACEADQHAAEKRLFKISIWYLFGLFAAIIIEAVLHSFGVGFWIWQ